jgi:hypothetical protein
VGPWQGDTLRPRFVFAGPQPSVATEEETGTRGIKMSRLVGSCFLTPRVLFASVIANLSLLVARSIRLTLAPEPGQAVVYSNPPSYVSNAFRKPLRNLNL